MNFNMDLWETTEAKEFGEIERLELGGHELVILDAREYKSEISGNVSLKVSVDIGGKDKQKGFFQKSYLQNSQNFSFANPTKYSWASKEILSVSQRIKSTL